MQKLFKDIYDNYYSGLCVFAARFVRSDEEAEEIVQEVILKLWENKDNLQNITSMKSYLYRSVYNRSLNYINHLSKEMKYRDRAWIEMKQKELAATDKILETELQTQITEAVDKLPARCREVFELSRFSGLKNKDIAEQLNISIKAVEANISRALQSLRQSLKEYLPVDLIVVIFFLYMM